MEVIFILSNIQLLTFLGLLPLKFVFILSNVQYLFVPLSLNIIFEADYYKYFEVIFINNNSQSWYGHMGLSFKVEEYAISYG